MRPLGVSPGICRLIVNKWAEDLSGADQAPSTAFVMSYADPSAFDGMDRLGTRGRFLSPTAKAPEVSEGAQSRCVAILLVWREALSPEPKQRPALMLAIPHQPVRVAPLAPGGTESSARLPEFATEFRYSFPRRFHSFVGGAAILGLAVFPISGSLLQAGLGCLEHVLERFPDVNGMVVEPERDLAVLLSGLGK